MQPKYMVSYRLISASQRGYTRDGIEITIPPNSVVVKIRNTFADRIKMRNMFILHSNDENNGMEINIDQSIIDRYFMLNEFMEENLQPSAGTTYFCVLCGAYFTDHEQYLLHQAMHLGLNSIDELIEYCALKHALNFFRRAVNLDDSD